MSQCVALMAGALIPTICVVAGVWTAAIVDQTFIFIWVIERGRERR